MKKLIIWIVLQFLYRGMKVLYHNDERMRQELDGWNQNKIIKLKIMNGPAICMKYTYLHGFSRTNEKPDIEIIFKSVDTDRKSVV